VSDPIGEAWRRGAFPYAYALSLVELTPVDHAQHPYRADAPPLEQATLWHAHGQRCWQLAKLDEADHALQRAYELRRPILGVDDPLTLDTAERLAAVASYRGDETLATERFTQAIAGLERVHGGDSVRVAIARRNFAAHLRASGHLGRAHALLESALEVLRTALSAEDPEHVDALKVQALLLHRQGSHHQALAVAERAIKLGIAAWDLDHPFVAAAHLTAASAEHDLGIYRSARKRLASVIACFERSYGAHPLTALALYKLACIELDDHNHDLAEELARRALPMYRAFHPTGFVATIATTLIRIAGERGQFADADVLRREFEPLAAESRRYRLPLALAQAQLATGRIAEGLANLRRAREVAPPPRHGELDTEIEAWTLELDEQPPR
jgi:tetratricopeptide (TPR) repeat protein